MNGWAFVGLGALALVLTPIVTTDMTQRRIPNLLNLALGLLGFALQMMLKPSWHTLGRSALAAGLTATLFLSLVGMMRLLRRRGELGAGDVKFLVAASQWVGFVGSAWVFVIATLLTLLWTLAQSPWRGFDLQRQTPFGPALAAGLVATYLALGAGA